MPNWYPGRFAGTVRRGLVEFVRFNVLGEPDEGVVAMALWKAASTSGNCIWAYVALSWGTTGIRDPDLRCPCWSGLPIVERLLSVGNGSVLGIGRVVGCGCRSGKWVRAEGCYNWQLRGGGGPP